MNTFIHFIEYTSSIERWSDISARCLAEMVSADDGSARAVHDAESFPCGPIILHNWLHEEACISRNIGAASTSNNSLTLFDLNVMRDCARYASVKNMQSAIETFSFDNIRALLYASTRVSRFAAILQKMADKSLSECARQRMQTFFDIYHAWKPHTNKCKRDRELLIRMLTISVASCAGAFDNDISLVSPACTYRIIATSKVERHVIIERTNADCPNKREMYFGEEISYPHISFQTAESIRFLMNRSAMLAFLWSTMIGSQYEYRMWVDNNTRKFYFLTPIVDGCAQASTVQDDILYYFWRYVMGMSYPGNAVLRGYGISKGIQQLYFCPTRTRGPCSAEYIAHAKSSAKLREKIGSWCEILARLRADCVDRPCSVSIPEIDGIMVAVRYIEALINPYN